jgi:hypothetical protein
MTSRFLIAALAVCAAVPAVAQPAPLPQRACLVQRNIYDFHPVAGNRSLIVTDVARRRYRLNFMAPCYNLQFKFGLRFKTFGVGTLSCVAKGDSVLLRDPVGPGQCIIRDVQYQTPAMDQADAVAAAAAKNR